MNEPLDKLARPEVRLFGRRRSAFRVCGYAGQMLAVLLAMALVIQLRLSPWVMAAVALSATATFLALTTVTKIIVGVESLIYYHQEIAIVAVTAVVLRLLHQPVLPYLDVTILGVGVFLACGRVGCLMVGCCHGRPHGWGVCYREEHAAAGLTPYFVGVRLFPVQLVEALCVAVVVLVGVLLILSGSRPGEALAWYAVAYGVVRFVLEFVRGDPERRHLLGFSEAQWTSLVLTCAVVFAELGGAGNFHLWHAAATVLMAATMIVVAVRRRSDQTARHSLLHPRHVREVAEAVEALDGLALKNASGLADDTEPSSVYVARTSRDIQISASVIPDADGLIHHYTLSKRKELMTEDVAGTIAGLILLLKHPSASYELVRGGDGVFHALVRPRDEGRVESRSSQNLVAREGQHAF
ncbi:MAG TPA: prolipoprotein diacylglyceryl transferase family protein [Pyrinomonadaceae bacterium]